MLKASAKYFVDIGAEFAELDMVYFDAAHRGSQGLTAQEMGDVQAHFENLVALCGHLDLKTAGALISARTERKTLPQTLGEFGFIRDTIDAELASQYFVYVPSHRLEYLDGDKFVSDAVCTAFPSASSEIRRAGSCYALEEFTACVFHAMRAAELGLRALGTDLSVRIRSGKAIELAEWREVLDGLSTAVRDFENLPNSTPDKEPRLHFYSEACAQFRFFKNGWRVRVAHARESYDESQAKEALDHVKSFFETLATRLREP